MKILCVNAAYSALTKMEKGRITEIVDDAYVLCNHKLNYYDAIPISSAVYDEIKGYVNQKTGYLVYDYKKGEIRFCTSIH